MAPVFPVPFFVSHSKLLGGNCFPYRNSFARKLAGQAGRGSGVGFSEFFFVKN
jgi:hypothetical protein